MGVGVLWGDTGLAVRLAMSGGGLLQLLGCPIMLVVGWDLGALGVNSLVNMAVVEFGNGRGVVKWLGVCGG